MAFGFGFNKAKVLASAEKNVKQGKLHNAIADYEKIAKEDARDLNVLNTIGDLYARVGNIEQATACFKRVGDAYAGEGFTVKAIAMYKKLTKQNPTATAALTRLAELYTQQGLYNDARLQYTAVADQYLRSGNLDAACMIFQKMLELDPDNPHMQGRLAELYVRLGKKAEARDIYFRSAQSLRARGGLDACDEALGNVLKLDPGFAQAVLLRGQVKFDAGDPEGAARCLEALPDIDSRPEGLRVLLRAQLKLENLAEAEPLARKLLTVFNDISGISQYADALMSSSQFEEALRFYREHADRLLATNPTGVVNTLHTLIARVKDRPRSLEILCELFQRAGNTTHLAEVIELLAHAYVQEGALAKARDLYQKLADLEPENPLHGQNYKQIVAKLGEDSVVRQLTPEQGAQALMVDELEQAEPTVEQKYPAELNSAIQGALTDAELFASYNLPTRAIPSLEAVLPRAPRDVQINQRLASLYARTGRYAEAAQCCNTLQAVFGEAGRDKEASDYHEMQARYSERAGIPVETAVPVATDNAPVVPQETATPSGNEKDEKSETSSTAPVVALAAAAAPPPIASATSAPGDIAAHEIDLSEEWDRVMSADQAASAPPAEHPAEPSGPEPQLAAPDPAPAPTTPAHQEESADASVVAWEPDLTPSATLMDAALGDIVEEVHFYVSQAMWDEARAAFARAEVLSPTAPAVAELRAQLAAVPMPTVAAPEIEVLTDAAEELPLSASSTAPDTTVDEFPVEPAPLQREAEQDPASVLISLAAAELDHEVSPDVENASPLTEPLLQPAFENAGSTEELLLAQDVPVSAAVPEHDVPVDVNVLAPDSIHADVSCTAAEPPLLDEEPAATRTNASVDTPVMTPELRAVSAPSDSDDFLGGFVLELEDSLGDDFAVQPTPPATAAAATASSPAARSSSPAVAATPDIELTAEPADDGSDLSLSDLFAEFKQDVESDTSESEDPETHYNLGVAFKEMGLLDEAIGELQKVCQSIEHGVSFPQVVEAYTWLADCFVQKGVPEAGIHWYEKALAIEGLGNERSLAIHYELACSNQAAGDLGAARSHFMHVLSVNIDYRDVAERIKALKS